MITRDELLKSIRKELGIFPKEIKIEDLTSLTDEDFIIEAFKVILHREPDLEGKEFYLKQLKLGKLSKEDIVLMLRYSDEGKLKNVKIVGEKKYLFLKKFKSIFKPIKEIGNILKKNTKLKEIRNSNFELTPYEYALLEREFRGEENLIKGKLRVYLPFVDELLEKFDKNIKALDLGCGDGYWMEILKEYEIEPLGVDLNEYFVKNLKKKGLNVLNMDAIVFLTNAEKETFHFVTAFHLIEHIDSNQRVKFLKLIYKVLKPGGVVIIETPNPRNILVGSGDFYRDPTHTVPVFPDTIKFLGDIIGFTKSQAYFFDKDNNLVNIDEYVFNDINDYINVSRDFVWIGKK